MPPRRAYHHGDLRTALIAAADAIVREQGLEGFSLREAARRAGVSPGAPAHHFGSVKGLLTEVALLGYDELARYLAPPLEDTTESAEGTVRRMAHGYVRFALDHPGHFRLMFRSDAVDRDDPRYGDVSARALNGLAAAACAFDKASGQTEGRIFGTWAAIHGMAHLILEGKAQYLFGTASADAVVDLALAALLARLPSPPD
ncbi:MAG: TetR/AcrR family transcriptional regulator [Gemmatimonadaceae bacterium]|jgi:AcrR family transcriptional regulator|nr:TetR/AcrR family transcriptional regulator [Gemmatimonadaceae bacterium]